MVDRALARARRHDDECVFAREHVVQRRRLARPQPVEAEGALERLGDARRV